MGAAKDRHLLALTAQGQAVYKYQTIIKEDHHTWAEHAPGLNEQNGGGWPMISPARPAIPATVE
jgi:hypothetical protein